MQIAGLRNADESVDTLFPLDIKLTEQDFLSGLTFDTPTTESAQRCQQYFKTYVHQIDEGKIGTEIFYQL